MWNPRPSFVAFAMIGVVLSGCVGSDDGASTADTSGQSSDVVVDDTLVDGGSVLGLVVNEELLPVAFAQVGILQLEASALTDEGGRFVFRNVAPGSYQIAVSALGYEAGSGRVEVAANVESVVEISLSAIPILEAYHDIFGPMRGQFSCKIGTPVTIRDCANQANDVVFPNDVTFVKFRLSAEHWRTMIGEATWDQGTAATGTGMALYPSYEGRSPDHETHWWCEGDGEAPVFFRYDRFGEASQCTSDGDTSPAVEEVGDQLIAAADPGFPSLGDVPPVRVIIQQKYDVYITMFYGDLPPDEFSALPDT